MKQWIRVARAADVPLERGIVVAFADREIALFRLGDHYCALDNNCPHKEAPLAEGGIVESEGRLWVYCPWHRFLFDPQTGGCDRPGFDTQAYNVLCREGDLYLEVSSAFPQEQIG
ncbi:MAG: nitrite reductase (NAD(P)H) small subunit [Anaerolineae bacterium]|nr:nitrite reductase (NAD(P)H) small subunit [Gloeobacterales cyanobacterium ES-bin-313]